MNAPGEQFTVVSDAVVILPGGDVARASGEVDVRHPAFFRAAVAGQADELGRDQPGAIHAGWMRGIVMNEGQRLILIVIADRLEHGIDDALGRGPDFRVGRLGPAYGGHLPVRPHHPSVGGNPVDSGLARRNMRAGLQPVHGLARCLRRLRANAFGPVSGHNDVAMAVRIENMLGIPVGPGCIVGVGALHGHPVRPGAHCNGQRFPPPVIVSVAKLRPVQSAQDHGRLVFRYDHETQSGERIQDAFGGRIPSRAKRMPQRRGHVGLKGGDPDHGFSILSRPRHCARAVPTQQGIPGF